MEKFQERVDIPKWKGKQRRIGITGGLASGKSTIGAYIEKFRDLPILDADLFSREALAPGSHASKSIIKRYSSAILENKDINRKVLSKLIFNDNNERLWLENLLHPIIYNQFLEEIKKYENASIIIMIIPLLLEAKFTDLCNEIWVVNCTLDQQCERLMKRDTLSQEEALKRIRMQWSLEQKIKYADVIIDNSVNSQLWQQQINTLI